MTVQFRLLGAIEADIAGRSADLGPARQQSVLVGLLVDVNHVVPVDQLMTRVWGDRLPHSARGTLSSYLSRLRRVLAGSTEVVVQRRSGGYLMTGNPASVDLHQFSQLLVQARATTDDEHAAALFEQASRLWRGDAFAGLDTPWLNQLRAVLHAEWHAAVLDHNDLKLRLGRHSDLLVKLSTHAGEHPLNERLAGQLMLALYRAGRQADALRVFQGTRTALIEELGLEPGPDLRQVHQRILTADPALTPTAGGRRGG